MLNNILKVGSYFAENTQYRFYKDKLLNDVLKKQLLFWDINKEN
jgi:hypothetical protein